MGNEISGNNTHVNFGFGPTIGSENLSHVTRRNVGLAASATMTTKDANGMQYRANLSGSVGTQYNTADLKVGMDVPLNRNFEVGISAYGKAIKSNKENSYSILMPGVNESQTVTNGDGYTNTRTINAPQVVSQMQKKDKTLRFGIMPEVTFRSNNKKFEASVGAMAGYEMDKKYTHSAVQDVTIKSVTTGGGKVIENTEVFKNYSNVIGNDARKGFYFSPVFKLSQSTGKFTFSYQQDMRGGCASVFYNL